MFDEAKRLPERDHWYFLEWFFPMAPALAMYGGIASLGGGALALAPLAGGATAGVMAVLLHAFRRRLGHSPK